MGLDLLDESRSCETHLFFAQETPCFPKNSSNNSNNSNNNSNNSNNSNSSSSSSSSSSKNKNKNNNKNNNNNCEFQPAKINFTFTAQSCEDTVAATIFDGLFCVYSFLHFLGTTRLSAKESGCSLCARIKHSDFLTLFCVTSSAQAPCHWFSTDAKCT